MLRALEALGLGPVAGTSVSGDQSVGGGWRGGDRLGPAPGSMAAQRPDLAPWMAQLRAWQGEFPLAYDQEEGGALKPQFVVETLRDATPDDTIVVAGVGQHQMWASQYWKFDNPNTWVNSGGAGTMGFAVPAAIGAKVGRPDKMVWAIDGDGCFQMTAQELVTASAERIPIKVAILNNAYLGMVRQWQELFYEERYSEVYLSPDLPDYVKWAEAMGCVGLKVESAEEVAPAIEKANGIDDRPVVIDFRTDAFEKVYPMVPAGASNDDIIVGPAGGRGGTMSPAVGNQPAVIGNQAEGAPPRHHIVTGHGREQGRCARPRRRLFSRRGFNIFSLAVAPTDDERFSRITIVVDVESAPLEQIMAQLDKLVNVCPHHRARPPRGRRARDAPGHDRGRHSDRAAPGHGARGRVRGHDRRRGRPGGQVGEGGQGGRVGERPHGRPNDGDAGGHPQQHRRIREPRPALRHHRAPADRPGGPA